jgi:hypothetical protein
LTDAICEAITHLQYYSGEFDIEWGRDLVYGGVNDWHNNDQDQFRSWLIENKQNLQDPQLSLGYLPLAQVDLQGSFGTTSCEKIWNILGTHLDIYHIETPTATATFEYCWTDQDYEAWQIEMLKPGYDRYPRK